MAKKKQDLKPDTVLKNYWSDNEQFADLFNAVLFDGRQVILPEEMKQFVNDYKMLLVEARENDLKLHNINNQDFFNLMEILLDRNRPMNETKDMAIDYAREHDVNKSVVEFLNMFGKQTV